MNKLAKSLAELDKAADALLLKSQQTEEVDKKKATDEPKPEDISDDYVAPPEEPDEDTEEPKKEPKEPEDDGAEDGDENEDMEKGDDPDDLDGEEPEDDEGGDLDDDEDDEPEEPEEIEKSIRDQFMGQSTIAAFSANSEFCSAVVDILAKSLADLDHSHQVTANENSNATAILAKSITAVIAANENLKSTNAKLQKRLNRLEKSMDVGFNKVLDYLDEISSQPAHMRKSMSSVNVHDRDFQSSINGRQPMGIESLSKAEILSVLNNELFSGNPSVSPQDIIGYESGAPLRTELQSLVASKVK